MAADVNEGASPRARARALILDESMARVAAIAFSNEAYVKEEQPSDVAQRVAERTAKSLIGCGIRHILAAATPSRSARVRLLSAYFGPGLLMMKLKAHVGNHTSIRVVAERATRKV